MLKSRMSTMNMLRYCDEALAWDEFSDIDKLFFESVRKILLGQCAPMDISKSTRRDLMGIARPVDENELEPEYEKYDDIYYGISDDEIPDFSSY